MKIRNRISLKKLFWLSVTSTFRSFWQLVLEYMYYVEFTESLYHDLVKHEEVEFQRQKQTEFSTKIRFTFFIGCCQEKSFAVLLFRSLNIYNLKSWRNLFHCIDLLWFSAFQFFTTPLPNLIFVFTSYIFLF